MNRAIPSVSHAAHELGGSDGEDRRWTKLSSAEDVVGKLGQADELAAAGETQEQVAAVPGTRWE